MINAAKIVERMRGNPRDWRIGDLKTVARHYGIEYRQQGTSPVVFWHPTTRMVVVPARRPIKAPYIRLFLALVDSITESE